MLGYACASSHYSLTAATSLLKPFKVYKKSDKYDGTDEKKGKSYDVPS